MEVSSDTIFSFCIIYIKGDTCMYKVLVRIAYIILLSLLFTVDVYIYDIYCA